MINKIDEKTVELIIPNSQELTISSQSVKKDLPKYWKREHIQYILSAIQNQRHKMLFKFLWMSGVRISEAVNLRKGDIDFQQFSMTVRWLKSRKYNYRVVPLHPNLAELLQLYTSSLLTDQRVFPITRQRAWQLCKKYFNGHPHQMRHSFAVNWLSCDGDLIILHKILGHSKVQTTMEYLKICPVDQGKELLKIQF